MNLNDAHSGGPPRIRTVAMLILVTVVAASCGPLGDDEDPTATSETLSQPTSESVTAPAPAGTDEPGDSTPQTVVDEISDLIVDGLATPAGTPEVASPDGEEPPNGGSEVVVSTPAVPGLTDDESGATPLPSEGGGDTESQDAQLAGSDGTSGATPAGGELGPATESTIAPEATPGGTPGLAVLEETAPPADVDLGAIDPVAVNSCDPTDVPLLVDGELSFVTTTDVNFRTGPGTDCDTIGEGPLGSNIPVAVLTAPVVREGDEENVWVQIRVNDVTGWVVVDFIEPAD